jgi:hypothetical protein
VTRNSEVIRGVMVSRLIGNLGSNTH